jgi:hypothetical protein
MVFHKDIIAFSILCALSAAFFGYAFFKNPKLLGKDFAQLQKEILKMLRNKGKKGGGGKGGKRRRETLEEPETDIEPGIAQITE